MMPAYNAGSFLHQAIDSVINQTYTHWELIIVDDGSTDNTNEIASSYADPRIRLVTQGNGGESVARNTALGLAKGDLLAYLDADDAFLPDHLSFAVAHLNEFPKNDAVYTDGYHINEKGERLAKKLSDRRRGPFSGDIFSEVVRASDVFGPPCCVVVRRGLIEEHNLRYDPRIVIGPDWDFFTQLAAVACFGYINQPTILYRVHFTNITVLTGMEKRRQSLAICREKAIQHPRFETLPIEIRSSVFYDLLINLLREREGKQQEVLELPQFHALPIMEQARLLRLMASQKILAHNKNRNLIKEWLKTAVRLRPVNVQGQLLQRLYSISPAGCRIFLRLRRARQKDTFDQAPFRDLTTS